MRVLLDLALPQNFLRFTKSLRKWLNFKNHDFQGVFLPVHNYCFYAHTLIKYFIEHNLTYCHLFCLVVQETYDNKTKVLCFYFISEKEK